MAAALGRPDLPLHPPLFRNPWSAIPDLPPLLRFVPGRVPIDVADLARHQPGERRLGPSRTGGTPVPKAAPLGTGPLPRRTGSRNNEARRRPARRNARLA